MGISFLPTLSFLLVGQVASAAQLPSANAAELTCHRIERLVILKKIDSAFLNSIRSMTIELTPQTTAGQPAFKTTSYQDSDPGKTPAALEVILDETGKSLSFNVLVGASATRPTAWTVADPVTIVENSLHWIEQNVSNSEIAKFSSGMKSLAIAQQQTPAGPIAQVEFVSNEAIGKLVVSMGLDGSFMSYSVVTSPVGATFDSIKANVFSSKCLACHQPDGSARNVPLETREDLLASTRDLVLPGNPDESGLVIAIERLDRKRMPPVGTGLPLNPEEAQAIRLWIRNGAKD
jgi:hypothetical protein